MIFSTYWFFAAVAVFLPLYWFAKTAKFRLPLLLAFCFFFHAHFAGPAGMAPIIVLGVITFFLGRSRKCIGLQFWHSLVCDSTVLLQVHTFFLQPIAVSNSPVTGSKCRAIDITMAAGSSTIGN